MAEDQLGQRKDSAPKTPWTKIFSTFKVALDVKKLLIAAAGILVMALGWWVLSAVFFFLGGTRPPLWKDWQPTDATQTDERFEAFKLARKRWNLRYQLAGRPSGDEPYKYDLADAALNSSYIEYRALEKLDEDYGLFEDDSLLIHTDQKATSIAHGGRKFLIVPARPDDKTFDDLKAQGRRIPIRKTRIGSEPDRTVFLDTIEVKIEGEKDFQDFKALRMRSKEIAEIRRDIQGRGQEFHTALSLYEDFVKSRPFAKPYGELSKLPWFENRGPNPYLMVADQFTDPTVGTTRPQRDMIGATQGWFLRDQVPVLLEPLYKFLRPVVYLFEPNAGFYNRLYFLSIILWALLTWAFFGGAICRMAAVQLARNEKVGLREALGFARSRCRSLFFGPVLPLLFLGLLTFFLIIFGILIGHTYFFGDIFLVPLFWPIILVFGLIMAVVLVGLVGYPLMNPTIATEGTDSFDALSRSYSYVYQAPWHYLWYSFLALLYGAALIFFVGLMGSLMVYMGKWGMSQAPGLASSNPERDREPHYLFVWAPTSFGWRDLLIGDSPHAERHVVHSRGGVRTTSYELSPAYMKSMSIPNYIGATFVTLWIYLFFLLIVGFGYSYFWTAATLIYLLMRRHVDDTDIDEVYLEDEEGPDTFTQDMMAPKPAAGPGPGMPPPGGPPPAGGGLQMVDSPALRTTPLPTTNPPMGTTPTPPSPAPTPSATPPLDVGGSDIPPPAKPASAPEDRDAPSETQPDRDRTTPPQGTQRPTDMP